MRTHLEAVEGQQFDFLAGDIPKHMDRHAPVIAQFAKFQPEADIASVDDHIAAIMGHGAALFERHIARRFFHLIELLQHQVTI